MSLSIKLTYEQTDKIITDTLKYNIDYLNKRDDKFETQDNHSLEVSSLYGTLRYFSCPQDYADFVQEQYNKHKDSNC